jgi:CheY-like chemotaxis protein
MTTGNRSGAGPTDTVAESIRVLLVDDQELIRTGLRRILRLRDGFDIVGECADGSEVLAAVAEHRPDIVVMDLRMRNIDGITATTMLRTLRKPPPVLVLTTFDDDLLSGALRAGAAGFILKDSPAEALIWAVRVLPPLQGLGIGGRLVIAAEEAIARAGFARAEIGVETDNPAARRLYERLDYRLVGTERGAYGYTTPEGVMVRVPLEEWVLHKSLSSRAVTRR